jgi:hypothetical protein
MKINKGSIVTGKSGKPMKVISINGEGLVLMADTGQVKAKLSAILSIVSQPTAQSFHLGDRVTLLDKYQVRAADIGTVEGFTALGIQILWDNNSPHEPNLKQPPIAWRTFAGEELELIDRMYQQN